MQTPDTEAQLQMEQHKLQTIFNESPAAMALWRGEDLIFEMVNPMYQAIFPNRELVNHALEEALPEFKNQDFPRLLRRVLRTGETYQGHEVLARLAPAIGDPLQERYYDFSFIRVNDREGKPYGVYNHALDVTERRHARLRLEENEKQIRAYAESLPIMASIADATGNVIYRNSRYYDYFGIPPGTALDCNCAELHWLHPADIEKACLEWQKALHAHRPYESEYRLRLADGAYHWHLARGVPALDGNGRAIRWYRTLIDIHEQKKMQEQLAEAIHLAETAREELYQLFMQVPAAMVILSGPSHLFRLANPAYERMMGRTVSGKTVLDVFTHEEVGDFLPLLNGVYQTGNPYIGSELPCNIPDEQGRMQNHLINVAYHPLRDKHGVITGVFAIHQDVTEQVTARKIIEERESRFRMLANSMPQIVWTARPDGCIDWYNDGWYVYTGVDRAAFRNDPAFFMHPDDVEPTRQRWKAALATGTPYEMHLRFLRKQDNQYRWHLGRAVPVRDPAGQIVLWLGTNTDIHDEKMLMAELQQAKAEAEKASLAKGAFLANMSHEIRTPLGAIIGFVDLLKSETIDREERERILDIMARNGQALTCIIDDILDLAKVESGKMDIDWQDFCFVSLLNEVIDLFRDKARGKGLDLRLNIPNETPACISSDPMRLRQILINILGNAIKFTHAGSVLLEVKVEAPQNERLALTLIVKDTGIGISPEQRERLFQPFMQADSSTTRNFGGTGLGLALSRRLANALGGDIRLEEASTQGSTFVITCLARVVRQPYDKPREAMARAATAWSKQPLSGVRILLADDAIDNQYLAQTLLTSKGATVDIASNGEEALRMALNQAYDVILMDVQMPKMDGYQATSSLRQAGFTKPIIALTAHAMVEEKAKSRDAGCNGHLTKPLKQADLIAMIRQHLPPAPAEDR